MNPKNLKKSDLLAGDILLCVFEHPGAEAYFESLIDIIKYYNYKNDADRKKFLENALIILRGLIITFDDDIYTHAAFWDGKAVVEAGLSGVKANPIDHYKNTITDIYRFTKNGQELNSEEFPCLPLVEKAHWLVDQNLSYSYETAYLYILLCLTRWKREDWIYAMKESLKNRLSANNSAYIELIFSLYHDKIILLFEWMADELIRQIVAFRKDDGLVCSETVAKIYNEAKPEGSYHIEKPLNITTSTSFDSKQLKNENVNEAVFAELSESLDEMPAMYSKSLRTSLTSSENVIDIEYTPHDLARSINTYLVGRLDLS